MFKILGADGKEYGPVSLSQLRQWISEGRAGAQTQVCAEGAIAWTPLQSLPEFAELFQTPPLAGLTSATVPPVVVTLAWAMFVVMVISGLTLLLNLMSVLRFSNFSPNASYYVHWVLAVVSLPARVVAGLGLLRGRVWARQLAIGLAVVLAVYGGWGLSRMAFWWVEHPEVFPGMLTSPIYLLSTLWSVATFLFNIATVLLLCRCDVRQFFAARKSVAPV